MPLRSTERNTGTIALVPQARNIQIGTVAITEGNWLMTVDKRHINNTGCPQPLAPVTAEEFATVDIEGPISGSKSVRCMKLSKLYNTAASEAEKSGQNSEVRVFSLLNNITYIHFKPENQSEPFGPFLECGGRRSMIPSDLRGDQSAAIARIVPSIQNSGLRARLADIVWCNDRKRADMAKQAIGAYYESVQSVLDRKANFSDEDQQASGYEGCNMLRRACQIAGATGWKDPEASQLRSLICAVVQDAFERRDPRGFMSSAEVALDFRIGDAASIVRNAETLASSSEIDALWAGDLWKLAADAHGKSRNQQERDRSLVNLAETFVARAEAPDCTQAVAAALYMDAIEALRKLPNTGPRRSELKEKMRRAQVSANNEMAEISTEIDLTEHARHSVRAVGGQSLSEALKNFVTLARSPGPDDLREEGKRVAKEYPLPAIIPQSIIDEDGKVIAKSPGLSGEGSDDELAMRHLILRNEGMRRSLVAEGSIEPARRQIQSEHAIDIHTLGPVVELTPYVPDDRVRLVTTGLFRFFAGDFYSALHILGLQLEHSLRCVLELADIDPTTIRSDMTQENRTLSVMLEKERGPLEKFLTPAVVFEIENLFDFRGGPSLRHRLAHGLVPAAEFHTPDAIYACWFMFRLYCLPLLPDWDKVAQKLDIK